MCLLGTAFMGSPLNWSFISEYASKIHHIGGLADADRDCSVPMIADMHLCLLQEQASADGREHAQGPPSPASSVPLR